MKRKIIGMMYAYFHLCKRKLWYSSYNIDMEQDNENVLIGRFIDDGSYSRKDKHLLVDGVINIDFIDKGVVHEIKKSKKMNQMAIAQAKYYIYYLRKMGVTVSEAVIDYPLLKKRQTVLWDDGYALEIEGNLVEIEQVLKRECPPSDYPKKAICRKCAFFDMCYIGAGEL